MPNAIPAGGAPLEKSAHIQSCFDTATSANCPTPEEFTNKLAGIISDVFVMPPSLIVRILQAANYTALIRAAAFGTAPAEKKEKARRKKKAA